MADKKNFRKGWVNPYEYNKNTLFDEDFEEPTYLSFKLEFGNWGASINTKEADKLIWEAQDVKYLSLDDLPMGLFNPNFIVPSEESDSEQALKNGISALKSTTQYSAVEYLYRSNEDTRAQLLQAFIEGWYDLQKNYQSYFQEISGLDDLFAVELQRGQRLPEDGVKITVKCLDDTLDQKIRYLLTLYRKAAWDDIWQRWVLPDIYRYFHLYIYISENRIFHLPKNAVKKETKQNIASTGDEEGTEVTYSGFNNTAILTKMLENITADNYAKMALSPENAKNIPNQKGGYLPWSGKSDTVNTNPVSMVLTALNGFAPVTVLDCGPCEFELSSTGSYNGTYKINEGNSHEMSFNIIVKNVKFYEKNPLMWRLGGNMLNPEESENKGLIFVKDLFNTKERQKYSEMSKSFNNYISQSFYNNDEIFPFLTESEESNTSKGDHFKAVTNMLSLYQVLKEEYNDTLSSYSNDELGKIYSGGSKEAFNSIFNSLTQAMKENKEMMDALMELNYKQFENESSKTVDLMDTDLKAIWDNLKNQREQLLQDKTYLQEIWTGSYPIDWDEKQDMMDRSWATDLDGQTPQTMVWPDDESYIGAQGLPFVDQEAFIAPQNLTFIDDRVFIPRQNLTKVKQKTRIPDQDLVYIDHSNNIPNQELIGVEQPDDRSWATDLDGWTKENDADNDLENQKSIYTDADPKVHLVGGDIPQPSDRSWATDLDGWSPDDDSDKNKMIKMDNSYDIPEQSLVKLKDSIKIPKQNLTPVKQESRIKKQHLIPMDNSDELNPELIPVSPENSNYTPTAMNPVPFEWTEHTSEMLEISPDYSYEPTEMDLIPMVYDEYEHPEFSEFNLTDNGTPEQDALHGNLSASGSLWDNTNIPKSTINPIDTYQDTYEKTPLKSGKIIYPAKETPEIQGVPMQSHINHNPNFNMAPVDLSHKDKVSINDVNIEQPRHNPPTIKPIELELNEYTGPGIRDINVELTNNNTPTIKNVELENLEYSELSIKGGKLDIPEKTIYTIRKVDIDQDDYKKAVIRPVRVEDSLKDIMTPQMVPVELEAPPAPKIQNVKVEKKAKKIFDGDLTKIEYETPQHPKIRPVDIQKKPDTKQEFPPMTSPIIDENITAPDIREIKVQEPTNNQPYNNKIIDDGNAAEANKDTAKLIENILALQQANKQLEEETAALKKRLSKIKGPNIKYDKDRSWATDLDGWNKKNDSDLDPMISMKDENKSDPRTTKKKKIKGPKLMM